MSWDPVLKLDLRFSVFAGLVTSAQDLGKNANARRNLFSVQSKLGVSIRVSVSGSCLVEVGIFD